MCSAPIGNVREFAVERPSSSLEQISRSESRSSYMSQDYRQDIILTPVQMKDLFQSRADRGDPEAQNSLGMLYEKGSVVEKADNYKALEWYLRSAEQGNPSAQNNLGLMYFEAETRMGKLFCQDRGGKNRDYKKALRCFTNAAHHDYAPALEMLGKIYYNGWGVQRNFDIAKEWFQKAADYGQSSAHNMLGTMYLRGEGGSKDFIKATEHYRKAAAQGDSSGVDNLQYSRQKKYILKAWCSM
ncbi:hypothetical protein BGZ76_010399 [Entomortierella beljakovae]|nr:hypothetical protein BGZ76_010399 [Entomortierella beljakovae]